MYLSRHMSQITTVCSTNNKQKHMFIQYLKVSSSLAQIQFDTGYLSNAKLDGNTSDLNDMHFCLVNSVSIWVAKFPAEGYKLCFFGKKSEYLLYIAQSICAQKSNFSGQPDIFQVLEYTVASTYFFTVQCGQTQLYFGSNFWGKKGLKFGFNPMFVCLFQGLT